MSNMYDILGKLKSVIGLDEKPVEKTTEPVYESVEPRGDIMEAVKSLEEKYMGFKKTVAAVKKGGSAEDPEAVAAAIGRKKYGKAKFQKAAAAGKKLGEAAKPDYIDLDKDGDKKEPMKQAAKDAKKKAVKEGEYDPAPVDPDAVAKRKRLQALKDKAEDERSEKGGDHKSNVRTIKGKAYGGAAQKDDAEKDDLDEMTSSTGGEITRKGNVTTHKAKKYGGEQEHNKEFTKHVADLKNPGRAVDVGDDEDLDEVAPPGAKAERMVKHIKKGYAKDGKLTKREKGIAYATAWKAHNKGQVEEATEFGDTIKNSAAKMTKAKKAKVTESRMIQEGDYFYEKLGKALAEKNPTLNTADSSFVTAVRQEMVAQGIEPNRARNIIMMDDDFISDVATSYGHYCKEIAECGVPMNSPMAEQELDEIARLAGLPPKEEVEEVAPALAAVGADLAAAAPAIGLVSAMKDGDLEEGNEYTKARLDAIKAGKDTFTVGGKEHKVTGDTSQEHSMEESTSLNDIRKLSGLAEADEEETEEDEEELAEERDIEWDNTPEEDVAPLSAAIPSGTDLHKSKKQDPKTANKAANPLKEKDLEESLWKSYEDMIKDVKA